MRLIFQRASFIAVSCISPAAWHLNVQIVGDSWWPHHHGLLRKWAYATCSWTSRIWTPTSSRNATAASRTGPTHQQRPHASKQLLGAACAARHARHARADVPARAVRPSIPARSLLPARIRGTWVRAPVRWASLWWIRTWIWPRPISERRAGHLPGCCWPRWPGWGISCC